MNIPPFISRTPPPLDDDEDDYDDFGSYNHDGTIEEESAESEANSPYREKASNVNKIVSTSVVENNYSDKLVEETTSNCTVTSEETISVVVPTSEENVNALQENGQIDFDQFDSEKPLFDCNFLTNVDVADVIISEITNTSKIQDGPSESLILQNSHTSNDDCREIVDEYDSINLAFENDDKYFDEDEVANSFSDESFFTNVENETLNVIESTIDDNSNSTLSLFTNITLATDVQEQLVQDDYADDDDFSDFADFQSSTTPSAPPTAAISSTSVVEDRLPNLFDSCWMQESPPEESFGGQLFSTNLVDENIIWLKLRYLEETPALKYSWSSSATNHKMLSALRIDSRNILHGPWSKSHRSLTIDGRFNDGAQLSLDHSRSASFATEVANKTSVPEAHFDWEGSGLTNPLFASTKDEHLLEYDLNNILTKKISTEAEDILQSIPKLSFMKKSFIVFNRTAS